MVVTDIVMSGLDGIAATVALRARRPGTRVVLVTVHDDPDLAERGYAALIEYPPRQSPESWTPGDVMENIKTRGSGPHGRRGPRGSFRRLGQDVKR